MRVIRHWRSLLPWLLCGICITFALVQAVAWLTGLDTRPSLHESVEALGWGLAMPALFSVIGALIITHQSRNAVGWLLMIPAVVALIPRSPALDAQLAAPPANPDSALLFYAMFTNWAWVPVIFPVMLIPLHFPSGATPSPRWRVADILAIFMVTLFTLVNATATQIFYEVNGSANSLPNPLGVVPPHIVDALFGAPWIAGLLTLVGLSVSSLFVRYRQSGSVVRQQIKWLLYACGFFAVVYAVLALASDTSWGGSGGTNLILMLSVLTLPVAIGIAILRYRLYDIDVIIRKSLLYAILTALLALVYFGLVLVLQTIFGTVSGEQSPAIIVVSTLVIAALFAPLRRRVQNTLDRRFFRKKYDAQQVLAGFAETTRDKTDMAALTSELIQVVQETLQPEGLSLWLREPRS